MGAIYSRTVSSCFPSAELRILMFGLGAAGKTTILYRLKLGKKIQVIPSIGFNIETLTVENRKITVWDLSGGTPQIRALWKHYFPDTKALVYVVDSAENDDEWINETKEELARVLREYELQETSLPPAPLLVLAHKQDLPNAKHPDELAQLLDLHSIKNRQWHIIGTNALNGDGLIDGMSWLIKQMN